MAQKPQRDAPLPPRIRQGFLVESPNAFPINFQKTALSKNLGSNPF